MSVDEQACDAGHCAVRSVTWANRLIEAFIYGWRPMVWARWIESQGGPGIYRIHELAAIEADCGVRGYAAGLGIVGLRCSTS